MTPERAARLAALAAEDVDVCRGWFLQEEQAGSWTACVEEMIAEYQHGSADVPWDDEDEYFGALRTYAVQKEEAPS